MNDRGYTKPHTKDELNAAAVAAQNGGEAEAQVLRNMMRPYVVAMTRSLDGAGTGTGYSRDMSDDLKQTIWEGVWIALPKFDPDAGTKFSTYAYFWMRHEAQEWMSKNSRALPLPRVAWAQSIRLEEAYRDRYPDLDPLYASDDALAALVILDPKGAGERSIPHAGDIMRAKRNAFEFEGEFARQGQTGTAEADYFEEAHDPDMDAIDTMNAMTELATSRDPRAEEEGLALAYKFVDRHNLPDEVAERMMEEAGL